MQAMDTLVTLAGATQVYVPGAEYRMSPVVLLLASGGGEGVPAGLGGSLGLVGGPPPGGGPPAGCGVGWVVPWSAVLVLG
jgi:hypothetical protein